MKKLLLIVFCLILALPLPAFAKTGWYFKPNAENEQPIVMGGSAVPAEYGCLYLGSPLKKTVYLTFDAGYENGNVEKTLDALERQKVKAAFFILPHLIKSQPELISRMQNGGHIVGNHTYSHCDVTKLDKAGLFDEIKKLEDVYYNATGCEMSKYFRPPEGAYDEKTLEYCRELGYTPVYWSFAYADWDNSKQPSAEFAKNKILSNLHPGMVMLLHPTSAANAAIIEEVIIEIKARGYDFGTLDELSESTKASAWDADVIHRYESEGLVFCDAKSAGKHIALTFDDGPHPTQSDEILAVLAKNDVSATFFVIGKNFEENPDVTLRTAQAGHEIALHGYSHKSVEKLSESELEAEIKKGEELLLNIGVKPKLFRPPGGDVCESAVQKINSLGYKCILWSWRLDTRDWACPKPIAVINTVRSNIHDGAVILFHDNIFGRSPTAEALKTLIPELKSKGYEFVTVSQLISLSKQDNQSP